MGNKREELLRQGLRLWVQNKCKGTLNYVTGTGKTYAAILAVEEFIRLYPKNKILIVCPTLSVIDNFKNEFVKFKLRKLLPYCEFICYASLKKEMQSTFSLVVLDEIHNIVTEAKLPFFNQIHTKGILGLSASLTKDQVTILKPYAPIVATIDLTKAQEENFVAQFTLLNYPVSFTSDEAKQYKNYTESIDYASAVLGVTAWKKIGLRSKLVYSAFNKLKAVKEISNLFPKEQGIIFSLTKEFSERIAEEIGDTCVVIHSGLSTKQRIQRLKTFTDKRTKISRISVTKIFDEGVTISRLSFGILAARFSKKKQQIQTIGRLLRTDLQNKHAFIIRIYVKDSVEEKWVKDSQENFNVINTYSYEQLENAITKIKDANR